MKLLLEPGSGALQRPPLGHPRVDTPHVLTDVRLTIATFHSPLPKFSVPEVARGAAGLSRLFHPTDSRVRQNYCRNAGAGPWSPHARQHSAALSTCHTTASTEKERRSITLDGQQSSGAEWGGQQACHQQNDGEQAAGHMTREVEHKAYTGSDQRTQIK